MMGGRFSGYGINRKEEVEKLMKTKSLTFSDVMNNESAISEFKSGNDQLMDYFDEEKML